MTVTEAAPCDIAEPGEKVTAATEPGEAGGPLVVEELLVEEISIDGMCGVY